MPKTTSLEIPQEEQAQMLAALRRARYGYLLALHILLCVLRDATPPKLPTSCSARVPACIAPCEHIRRHSWAWSPTWTVRLSPPLRTTVLVPTVRRSLVALLKAPPRAYGWCRTRWSCATLALTLQTKHGLTVSAETMRRWVHEVGWVWKRAKLVAKDDEPHRVEPAGPHPVWVRAAQAGEALVFADELDIHLLPKVGCAWMPTGASGGHDAGPEREALLGRRPGPDPPGRCTMPGAPQDERAVPRPAHPASRRAIRLTDIRGSMWWSITIRFIRPKRWSSGWPPIRG